MEIKLRLNSLISKLPNVGYGSELNQLMSLYTSETTPQIWVSLDTAGFTSKEVNNSEYHPTI